VESVKRGDLVTIAVSGDYGKPRPAVVIKADAFSDLGSVTVLRLTSTLQDKPLIRISVHPSSENGLRIVSQVMVDRAISLPRDKIGATFGMLDDQTIRAVDRVLVTFLGLGTDLT
jgi:mRNA interferase MazF